jgi:hypothetical protein
MHHVMGCGTAGIHLFQAEAEGDGFSFRFIGGGISKISRKKSKISRM